jgi:hypothetical protein
MTVAAVVTETVYALAGAALGPFNTVWPYNAPGDVTVQLDAGDGNGPRLLAQGTDYQLTARNPTLTNGGSITLAAYLLTSPAWLAGAEVALVRVTARSQPSSFGEAVGFSPQASEQALDNVERQVQELTAQALRTLRVEFGDGGPLVSVVPGTLWGIDNEGEFLSFQYGNYPLKYLGTNASGALALLSPPAGGGGGGTVVTGAGLTVASYDDIRQGAFVSEDGSPLVVTLADPHKGGVFMLGAPGQRDDGGTVLVDSLGQSWVRIFSGRVNAAWFYNAPAGYLGDGSGLEITAADVSNNPQWIGLPHGGAYPVGTTWAYVALQEWLYAGFAGVASTPGKINWNSESGANNRALWCPVGTMKVNQGLFLKAAGLDIEFSNRKGSQIVYTGPSSGVIPLAFDAISFGSVSNLSIADQAVTAGVGTTGLIDGIIVDINYSGALPGLATQQLTFYDWAVGGANAVQEIGIYISRSGNAAQGDTILFVNPLITQCGQAGMALGGQNTLSINIVEGDFQDCWRDGVMAYVGTVFLYGTSFQAAASSYWTYPQANQITMGGADVHLGGGSGGTAKLLMYGVRSENMVMVLDISQSTGVRDSGIAQAAGPFQWNANAQFQLGTLLQTGSLINPLAVLVDDSGPAWFVADPASTDTHVINPNNPGWTPNAYVGWQCWMRYGNGYSQAGAIASNDADSFTTTSSLGYPAGDLLCKISKLGGATKPNFDTAAPGFSSLPGSPGYGFSTTAGSNVIVTAPSQVPPNGQYVMICAAQIVQAPGEPPLLGPLIGKVAGSSYPSGTSFSLVDATGAPINANQTVKDQPGYWGPGLVDGGNVWLMLDFDVVMGVASAHNLYCGWAGRSRWCASMELQGVPQANFIRHTEQAIGTYRYFNGAETTLAVAPSVITATPWAVTLQQTQEQNHIEFTVEMAAFTLNMPALGDALIEEMMLTFVNATAASVTGTWGAGIKAAAPTFTLPNENQTLIARLTWIGNRAGGGSWYVGEVAGPM